MESLKLECLQRLVSTLAARGELATLCTLPYSGNCEVRMSRTSYDQLRLFASKYIMQNIYLACSQAFVFADTTVSRCISRHEVLNGRGHWGAQVERQGRTVVASLLEEVQSALHRRTEHMDVRAVPQPHKVLFDFCVARSNLQGAAGAMLAYARRLAAECGRDPDALEQAAQALGEFAWGSVWPPSLLN